MFLIEMNNNRSVIIKGATKAVISSIDEGVKFLNDKKELVGFYKMNEIKGFTKDENGLLYDDVLIVADKWQKKGRKMAGYSRFNKL